MNMTPDQTSHLSIGGRALDRRAELVGGRGCVGKGVKFLLNGSS